MFFRLSTAVATTSPIFRLYASPVTHGRQPVMETAGDKESSTPTNPHCLVWPCVPGTGAELAGGTIFELPRVCRTAAKLGRVGVVKSLQSRVRRAGLGACV